MNTQFNTIETISNDSTIINKASAYLEACNQFEIEASEFATNENFLCRKAAEEVSLTFEKVKSSNCEYTMYCNSMLCEEWLEKAYNNAD